MHVSLVTAGKRVHVRVSLVEKQQVVAVGRGHCEWWSAASAGGALLVLVGWCMMLPCVPLISPGQNTPWEQYLLRSRCSLSLFPQRRLPSWSQPLPRRSPQVILLVPELHLPLVLDGALTPQDTCGRESRYSAQKLQPEPALAE